jgi:hypothetical protein
VIQHEVDHLNGVLICDYNHSATETCGDYPQLLAMLTEEEVAQPRPKAPE